ncbi:MAG: efflux RND transporter permease subunit [Synergistaceae bacterium]|jgi:hydrophobe/amphiphile efflux-1 (HAE1) family protein|nr:efflux RND transporter permease subunit [Synergistaceae bacterium]
MFSNFFINRPRFAMVIACVLSLAGAIAGLNLPVKQYPDVAPPTVIVFASYPGADAATISNTLAAPLEEAMNGVDDMIYIDSTSSNSGMYNLTLTFKTGSDPDMALVNVQNRLQQVTPLLPTEVTQRGLTVLKSFSDTLGFLALSSPKGTRGPLFLLDYAYNNVSNFLKRVPGMGDVQIFGAPYSIRVWLKPDELASRGLSTSDVASAISSQNRQASLGSIGAGLGETDSGNPMVYPLAARGRLSNVRGFEEIIIRTTGQGGVVKLKDVARIELGAESYNMSAMMNGSPVAMMLLSQAADANALDVMNGVRAAIAELTPSLPDDVEFVIGYDTTDYVRETISEIIMTLALTFTLVVFVCYLFLQNWRVTLVPVAAIPVSLIATFIGLSVLGFSINILTLFGLVLVIGTVVDDAIIVVERVMFVMERDGSNARDATVQAMRDVTGPMTATTMVFLAIFVPVTFMQSITGVIYRQFAVTISFSVVFSLVVALTLSPAMCAHILNGVKPKTRGPLSWFNKFLAFSTKSYVAGAMWIARRTVVTVILFAAVAAASYYIYRGTPTEFIPEEDQGGIFAIIQLPEGASQTRTRAVMNKMIPQLKAIPGAKEVISIEGFSLAGDSGENVGTVVVALDTWSLREDPGRSQNAIAEYSRAIAAGIPEAQINVVVPPAISGLGIGGGLDVKLQSRLDNDPVKLAQVMNQFIGRIFQSPEFRFAFSSYTASTPHLFLDIDREKAEMMGIPVSNIFSTLQTYFGTAYINDINIGSQVNKVILQSDWMFRDKMESVDNIYVKSSSGARVPLQSFVTLKKTLEPRSITRYNLYPTASITVGMNAGYSTGQGIEKLTRMASELPEGYVIEWSGMTYQERQAAGQTTMIIVVALVFGYLFLVAQYESWTVPMGVMLSLPVALLGSLIGIRIMGLSLSIYAQLGILLLVGLAAKNAILIIEFAQEQREVHGRSILEAAAEAGRERFRSVMMTALTCVIGVSPMLAAKGAGAGSRLHVGSTMFFGMGMATVFGIFLIPGLYTALQTNRERIKSFFAAIFWGSGKKETVQNETKDEID